MDTIQLESQRLDLVLGSVEEMRAWIGSPLPAVLIISLLIAMFYHAQLGLQVVIEDYIHAEGPKLAVLVELIEMHSMQVHGVRKGSVVSDVQPKRFTT